MSPLCLLPTGRFSHAHPTRPLPLKNFQTGPDTFFARVGKDAVLKTALLPAVSVGVKSASKQAGLDSVNDIPLAVLAPAIGVAYNAVRALIPV